MKTMFLVLILSVFCFSQDRYHPSIKSTVKTKMKIDSVQFHVHADGRPDGIAYISIRDSIRLGGAWKDTIDRTHMFIVSHVIGIRQTYFYEHHFVYFNQYTGTGWTQKRADTLFYSRGTYGTSPGSSWDSIRVEINAESSVVISGEKYLSFRTSEIVIRDSAYYDSTWHREYDGTAPVTVSHINAVFTKILPDTILIKIPPQTGTELGSNKTIKVSGKKMIGTFDVLGRKLNPLHPGQSQGFYIQNGKKIVRIH